MCQPKNCCDYYCNTVIMAISYRVGQKLQAHIFSYHIVATVATGCHICQCYMKTVGVTQLQFQGPEH